MTAVRYGIVVYAAGSSTVIKIVVAPVGGGQRHADGVPDRRGRGQQFDRPHVVAPGPMEVAERAEGGGQAQPVAERLEPGDALTTEIPGGRKVTLAAGHEAERK